MTRSTCLLPLFVTLLLTPSSSVAAELVSRADVADVASGAITQYVLFNRAPGQGMYQGVPETLGCKQFEEVLARFPNRGKTHVRTGLSYVFSCFRTPPETTLAALRVFLQTAAETDTPVLVQIDTEHWWDARPDLWNWWDPTQPGYDPTNRENVEWTGWSSEKAIKIAWRNWGRQIRVLPPPNLASPRYTAACREEIRRLVPVVMDWHARLPQDKKHLLVGIKLGHETSIGVNAYHYPSGNELLDKPVSEDPAERLNGEDVLGRGMAQLGYAALTSSGLRSSGEPTESELRDVAQRYLQMLCQEAADAGVPRELLFAHGAGWREGELIYDVPVNPLACPGWSFYNHAADPRQDSGVQRNVAKSDAPYWAATEWLLQGTEETIAWRSALANTLSDPRCRYVCIFNWESIRLREGIEQAITTLVEESRENASPLAENEDVEQADAYIPPPAKVDTGRYLVGAVMCPIWNGGAPWKHITPFPDREPLLGWYDEGTPEVTDWEIKWALEHGVSYFLVCWYREKGNDNKPVKPALEHWLRQGLFHSRFGSQFKFAINFENNHQSFCGQTTQHDLLNHLLPFWIENYFRRPNYLRLDGKPILAIYNVERLVRDLGGEQPARIVIDKMRSVCREAGVGGLHLIGQYCWGGPAKLREQAELIGRIGMDASWSYHWPTFTGAFGTETRPTGEQAIAAQERLWQTLPPRNILTLSLGWDSEPWRFSHSHAQWQLTPEQFRTLCQRAKSLLDQRNSAGLEGRLVLLDNWNEYGEGHYLFPTRGTGFGYLDAVRDVFASDAQPHSDLVPADIGRGPYDSDYRALNLNSDARH